VHRYSYAPSGLSEVVQWDGDLLELDRARPMEMVVRPRGLVMLTDHGTPGAEKFRSLAIRLKNFQKRQGLKKLLVTSSVKGEGKSVISANLAVALAQTQRTLLIDCDLHQAGLRDVSESMDKPVWGNGGSSRGRPRISYGEWRTIHFGIYQLGALLKSRLKSCNHSDFPRCLVKSLDGSIG